MILQFVVKSYLAHRSEFSDFSRLAACDRVAVDCGTGLTWDRDSVALHSFGIAVVVLFITLMAKEGQNTLCRLIVFYSATCSAHPIAIRSDKGLYCCVWLSRKCTEWAQSDHLRMRHGEGRGGRTSSVSVDLNHPSRNPRITARVTQVSIILFPSTPLPLGVFHEPRGRSLKSFLGIGASEPKCRCGEDWRTREAGVSAKCLALEGASCALRPLSSRPGPHFPPGKPAAPPPTWQILGTSVKATNRLRAGRLEY